MYCTCAMFSSVACPHVRLQYVYHVICTIFVKENYWTWKVFWFSLKLLSEISLILIGIDPDIKTIWWYVEIKCQLDATEVFIADLIACSTCFGHHYAHHQELKSGCCLWYFVLWFSSCWSGVELRVMCPVCRMLQHPAFYQCDPVLGESAFACSKL